MEQDNGMFWSHGAPLMKFNEQPPSITDPKLNYFPAEHPYPEPVSEGKYIPSYPSDSLLNIFQMNYNTRKFVTLQIGHNIVLVQRNSSLNISIHFFVHTLFMLLLILVMKHS